MTKSYSKKKEKIDLKSQNKKYRYLSREKNLKSRRYFIETDYVNGLYDENGNQVMRPLNPEEMEWLNQFYKEDLCVNRKNSVHYDESDDKLWSELYHDNYARYMDLYNMKQRTGKLITVPTERFDIYSQDNVEDNAIKFAYTTENDNDILEQLDNGVDNPDGSGEES